MMASNSNSKTKVRRMDYWRSIFTWYECSLEPGCSRAFDAQEDVVPSDIVEPLTEAVAEVTPLPSSSPFTTSSHSASKATGGESHSECEHMDGETQVKMRCQVPRATLEIDNNIKFLFLDNLLIS